MSKSTNSEYWSSVIVTLYSKFPYLLNGLKKDPNYSQKELRNFLKWSNGTLCTAIRDAKNMELIIKKNGSLMITDLGKRWLEYLGKESEDIPFDLKKETTLNLELFRQFYENNHP